jgi:undecaprenyl pyrophosphate phosphatase UppP
MLMTENEMKDLADAALEIYEEGIEVSLKSGDLGKVFVAVIAANVVTYITAAGLKTYINRKPAEAKSTSSKKKKNQN